MAFSRTELTGAPDTEFTIEDGRLYMLQTRSATRPAPGLRALAVDAVNEGLLTTAEAIATIDANSLDPLLHPRFDPDVVYAVLARGVAASPGAAKGAIVFTGSHAAKGILTSEGGKASHAALVARGMGRPAVTGAAELDVDLHAGELRAGDLVLRRGDLIATDGSTARSPPMTYRSWRHTSMTASKPS